MQCLVSSNINSIELSILLPSLFLRERTVRDLMTGSWNLFINGLDLGFIDIMYLLPDLRGLDSAGGTQHPRGTSDY